MSRLIPYKFQEDNRELTAPDNWDADTYGPCATLPVHVDVENACYVSRWKLGFRNRLLVLLGYPIQLTVKGFQPPVIVEVVE